MRDHDAYEDAKPDPAWCPTCNAVVQPKHIDMGIGPWEMGSQRGWHHDWCVACPDCECTKLTEPPIEEEG